MEIAPKSFERVYFDKIYSGFGFSEMTSEDHAQITYLSLFMEEQLNLHLDLKKYSQKVQKYTFIFMAINPQFGLERADKKQFLRSSQTIRIFMNLDREKLDTSTPKEILKQMCELYLKGIELYLFKRKDFLAKQFYEDVQEVFKTKLAIL